MDKETFCKMETRVAKYRKLKETKDHLDDALRSIVDGRVSRIITYNSDNGERNFNIPMSYQPEISQLISGKLQEIIRDIDKKMEEL